jgi:hypothetical protein
MAVQLQIVTALEIQRRIGQRSVVYELNVPPYTWYRWDGEQYVEFGALPVAPDFPVDVLRLDDDAISLDDEYLSLA